MNSNNFGAADIPPVWDVFIQCGDDFIKRHYPDAVLEFAQLLDHFGLEQFSSCAFVLISWPNFTNVGSSLSRAILTLAYIE